MGDEFGFGYRLGDRVDVMDMGDKEGWEVGTVEIIDGDTGQAKVRKDGFMTPFSWHRYRYHDVKLVHQASKHSRNLLRTCLFPKARRRRRRRGGKDVGRV